MQQIIRYILGYATGLTIFFLLIPYGIYSLSIADPVYNITGTSFIPLRLIISLPFLIPGLIFMLWSNVSLFLTGKGGPADAFGVAISPRTRELVTNGPYRYSRNPMVFGAFCLYTSIAVFYFSVSSIFLLIVLLRLVSVYIIKAEERRLLKDFGDKYTGYLKTTPRFFPGWKKIENLLK